MLLNCQGSLQPRPEVLTSEVELSYLRKAQIQWERRIQKSLNSMCNELNVPLARIRPNADREELAEKWNELSTYDIGKVLFWGFFFSPSDNCCNCIEFFSRFIAVQTTIRPKRLPGGFVFRSRSSF